MNYSVESCESEYLPFRCVKIAKDARCDALHLRLDGVNVICDTDCPCTGEVLAAKLKEELHGEPLSYILLSHSHYDHAGGAPFLQEVFPEAEVIAAEHAAEVFLRESARERMLRLDDSVASLRGIPKADRSIFHRLHADRIVQDGEILDLGGHQVQVIYTPGHTRDSVCYFFMDDRFLLSTETLGLHRTDHIYIPMLLGSAMTLASLEKIKTFPVRSMMLPHAAGVIFGEQDCRTFFDEAIRSTQETRTLLFSAMDEGKRGEELKDVLLGAFGSKGYYDSSMVKAKELNTSLIVKAIGKEWEKLHLPA